MQKLAGVMVTDLVGSTALRGQLGDHAAEELRRGHEKLLRAVVGRHRGRVVQWLGDGILAEFPSVSAAARAAIGVQQANDRSNRRPRRLAELAIRVGVGGGEVCGSEQDCTGRPVDAATALSDAARGGQILTTPDALELVGSRIALRTRALGEVVEIDWQPIGSAAEQLGLPPALRTTGQPPFVGRGEALARLRAVLTSALGGQPQLVILRGDAGIGKTRLAAEIAGDALARGAVVLYGAAHDQLAIPYEPVAQALRFWLEHIDDLAVRLGPRGGELVRLVPELADRVPDLPPATRSEAETERLLLYDALAEWVTTMSLDDPVVMVLDSLHWASDHTLELLRHVLRTLGDGRVMLVTTHRSSDARADGIRRWAEEVIGREGVSVLDLAGLQPAELEELVVRTGSGAAITTLSGAIHTLTGGNPLYVSELLRGRSAGDTGGVDLLASVRAVIRANLDALDARVRSTLQAAAVLGTDFEAPLLAAVQGEEDASYEALEAAARAGLVIELDRASLRYRFNHDLTRETVYASIGAARAARLHERAGQAIETRGDGADTARLPELARHFAAAAALGNRERAARYAARAGQWSLAQYANEQAAQLFADALRLLGEAGDRGEHCDLCIGRGEALRRMGDSTHRALLIDAAEQAHALGDGGRMGRALLATYRGTFSRGLKVDAPQVERLRKALELVGKQDLPLRARLLALVAVETVWDEDRQRSRADIDEAVAVAHEVGDEALLAEVLAHRQWAVYHPLEERMTTTEALDRLASASPDPLLRFESAGSATFTYVRAGDRAALDRSLTSLRAVAAEIDQPLVRWMLLIREAMLALMEGRFGEAEAAMEEGRELGHTTGQPDIDHQYTVQRFWLGFEQSDPEATRSTLRPLAESWQRLRPINWPTLALGCCELGLFELGRPILAALSERGIEQLPRDQVWLWTLCQTAEASARLGDARLGRELMAALQPCHDEHANMVFSTLGSVSRYLGLLSRLLGQLDEAERWLRAGEQANQTLGAVTWLARTRLDLAELRFERFGRDDEDAQQALEHATAAARELGLRGVLERAGQLAPA